MEIFLVLNLVDAWVTVAPFLLLSIEKLNGNLSQLASLPHHKDVCGLLPNNP
jgi:hypothetical protein